MPGLFITSAGGSPGVAVTVPTFVATATAALAAGPSTPAAVAPPTFVATVNPSPATAPVTLNDTLWLIRVFPTVYGKPEDTAPNTPPERVLQYGNVFTDIVERCLLFSTIRVPATLGALAQAGTSQGVVLAQPISNPAVPPPNPPAPTSTTPFALPGTINPGQMVPFDVVIYVDHDFSTIWVRYMTAVGYTNLFGSFAFNFAWIIKGSRALLMAYMIDWENGVDLDTAYPSDVFDSDQRDEQRTSCLLERVGNVPAEVAHTFDVTYKSEGRERSVDLWNAIQRIGARRAAIPFFTEPMILGADAAGLTTITPNNLRLEHMMWVSDEIVRLDKRRPGWSETLRVTGKDFTANTITTDSQWRENVPPESAEFFFVRYVLVTGCARTSDSDEHQTVAVGYRSVD